MQGIWNLFANEAFDRSLNLFNEDYPNQVASIRSSDFSIVLTRLSGFRSKTKSTFKNLQSGSPGIEPVVSYFAVRDADHSANGVDLLKYYNEKLI